MLKKLLHLIAFITVTVSVNAQNCFWHENFDDPSLRDSCTTIFNGTHGFAQNSRLFTSALYSDTAYIDVGDTIELRTDCFDLTGLTYAILSFNHICKIDFFDVALVEISLDCGQNWFTLQGEYITDQVNPPGAPFAAQGYQFSAASYPVWAPGNPNAVPLNSWWKTEYFDISPWANLPDVRIRFIMWDSNIPGGNGNSGWAIDDICIVAAPCELTPPTLSLLPPLFINTVYNLGPYNVNVATTDNSGINSVTLFYSVNGSPYTSVVMNNTQDSIYVGQIPAVNDGDTVCYYVVSEDGSACLNQTTYPQSGCIQFVASQGISFPFCDNFDIPPPLFSDSTALGATPWQLGVPTNSGYTAQSPPNVWAVGLNTIYGNNANSFLYSPVFGTIPIGTKLSFWANYNTETSWDGTRLEYSTDGGVTWALLGDLANSCGCQVNWYTNTIISSGNQPAWAGASNGWKKAEYTFPPAFPYGPNIQFRFIFTSDASVVVSHFAIDNFCIETPQPFDAGIPNIVGPVGFAPAGSCQDVTVNVQNYGLNPISNFDIFYSLNINGTVTTFGPFPFTGTLTPGQVQQVTLPCATFPAGQFTLCAWTSLPGDGNALNDTSCTVLVGIPVITLGTSSYCDDFESGNQGWSAVLNTGGAAGTTWQLGTPAFGPTTGAHSGVNAWDINLNSAYTNSANTSLYTPIFDFSSITLAGISFWINYSTETGWDGVRVEYTLNGSTWTQIGANGANPNPPYVNWYTGNMNCSNTWGWAGTGTGWIKVEMKNLTLLGIPGQSYVQFRFTFCSDASVIGDGFSLDDFCIDVPQPFDAGVSAISAPAAFAPAGSCQPVTVTLENFGLNPLTSFDVYYRVTDNQGNTTVYGPYPWTGNLAPGTTTQFTMPCFNFPSGGFTLCSWTSLVNDGNALNDTTCKPLAGMPTIPLSYTQPYCDNFDGPNIGWASQANVGSSAGTNWQLGTPAFGATTGAHSGANAWDINLNSTYTANASVSLYSPFFDMTNAVDTRLTFWRNNNLPAGGDGVRLEYTLNQGATWTPLGTLNATPPYINWYSSNLTCANALPGWSGNSSGWVLTQMQNLGAVGGAFNGQPSVQFRFTFCSDGFTQTDGFSLDDFCLEVPVPLTAAPVTIKDNAPTPLIFSGQTIQFRSHIKNRGTTPLNEVEAQLWIDGNFIGANQISYSPALLTGDSALHNFPFNWVATAGFHNVCVVTANPNSSVDQNPTDDTLCYTIQVIDTISVTSAPYCNDFESGPQWVALSALSYKNNSKFQLGTPNQTVLNSAHSGVNAWMTDLNNNYPNRDTSGLFTPVFTIDPAKTYKLSFWHQFNIEPFADGGAIDYSTDYGNTWQTLGGFNPNDWYNSPFIISFPGLPPGPGFTGFPGNYIFSQFEQCFGGSSNAVFFRFRFMSDLTGTFEGWAIDDVCFEEAGICPTGISEQIHGNSLWQGQNVPNPANEQTVIPYYLPEAGQVTIEITDLLGKIFLQPFNNSQTQGSHYAVVNTTDLKAGVYFYTLTLNDQKVVKRLVITR